MTGTLDQGQGRQMARVLAFSLLLRYRALFLDACLLDSSELEGSSIATILIVGEYVVVAVCRLTH